MYHCHIFAFIILTFVTFARCQDPRILQAILNYPTVVEEFEDQVSALSKDVSVTDVFVRAQSLRNAKWTAPSPYNVSERCLNDTFTMLAALGNQHWAQASEYLKNI